MRVALIHDALLPAPHYGGTERVIWWLAKALSELGHTPVLCTLPGTECSFAEISELDFSKAVEPQLPPVDVSHYFAPPKHTPALPYVVTIGGNGGLNETFLPNTVFVSRNHAERHGSESFVYNGIDPADYEFRAEKEGHLLFLAKASWRVKNVAGAIRLSRETGNRLHIVGGKRWWLPEWRGVSWKGMLGGIPKAKEIAGAKALVFPVIWDEPFGLAVVEALVSGTPVIASRFGSLPELVPQKVGRLCSSKKEFLDALESLHQIKPSDCREWAIENFHYHRTAEGYLKIYDRVLKGEQLNRVAPQNRNPNPGIYPLDL